jgi:hypothetical protein
MSVWLNRTVELLQAFFVRESPGETYAVIALCVLLGALALSRVSTALGGMWAFFFSGIFLTAGGLILLVAGLTAPSAFGWNDIWMPMAAAGLVFLLIVLPLTALLQRSGYIATLIAWTVTLLVIGAFLALEPIMMSIAEKAVQRGYQLQSSKTIDWSK